jgi:hypothetical protein
MWRGPAGGSLIWEVIPMTDQQLTLGKQDLRDQAIARLKQKRDFGAHLLVYLLVNAFLIAIWAFTGAGFFWPVFRYSRGASGWRSAPGTCTGANPCPRSESAERWNGCNSATATAGCRPQRDGG